jgi:hexulose-6-phosphate isomerase
LLLSDGLSYLFNVNKSLSDNQMERRNFLKKGMIVAGAAAFSKDGFAGSIEGEAKPESETVSSDTLKKSIMWGTVGMEGTILDKCKAIKEAGFQGVEPNSHLNRSEMAEALKITGLKASSVCNSKHWGLPLSHDDVSVRKEGIKEMIVAMDDAAAYGTDAVLLVPGIVNDTVTYQQCWDRSTYCIKELIPVAEEKKVKICIENVWNNFLLSPIEMSLYLNQFNSDYVCAYFDCGNILVYGWPEQWISTLGNRIGRIHIKEFSKQKADKEGRWAGFNVPLTEGDVRWKEVIAEARKRYKGVWLTTEQGDSKTLADLKDLNNRLDKIMTM